MAIPISELRIGSRTHSPDGKLFIVASIQKSPMFNSYFVLNKNGWKLQVAELKGIPLTREELAKHGFTIPIGKDINDLGYQSARIIFNGLERIIILQPPLEYLHQLQNIIYDLQGKELT